jgi:hypothetical protein
MNKARRIGFSIFLTMVCLGLSGVAGLAPAASGSYQAPRSMTSPLTPLPGPGAYSATHHWYAGGVYSGSSGSATVVTSQIKIPIGKLPATQFYYVILSIWDNTGSYDQIGFTNDYGAWGLAYSYTTGLNPSTCKGTVSYHYSSNAVRLAAGTTYNFTISISGGTVSFNAWSYNTHVFTLSATNGATSFSVAASYCGYYDYTVYEEAYMLTARAVPNHSFLWSLNDYFGTAGVVFPGWTAFKAGPVPAAVIVTVTGNKVFIKN